MTNWRVTPERIFKGWAVVEDQPDGTTRVIADDKSYEEACLIATSHAMRDALGLFLTAAGNGELPSDVVRMAAMEVYLAAQGLGERSVA